jgi:hypothetical protein
LKFGHEQFQKRQIFFKKFVRLKIEISKNFKQGFPKRGIFLQNLIKISKFISNVNFFSSFTKMQKSPNGPAISFLANSLKRPNLADLAFN